MADSDIDETSSLMSKSSKSVPGDIEENSGRKDLLAHDPTSSQYSRSGIVLEGRILAIVAHVRIVDRGRSDDDQVSNEIFYL